MPSGMADAGDIRYRLVQQLLREGAKRGAARFHVACADADGNVELLMQAGFIRYGEEQILSAPAGQRRCPSRGPTRRPRRAASARRSRSTRSPLHRLYRPATPAPGRPPRGHPPPRLGAPGQRIGGCRAPASPRSCASPTSRPSSRTPTAAARTGRSSTASSRSASPRRTSRTISRSWPGPRRRVRRSSASGWASSRRATARAATIATTTASSLPCEPTNHRSIGGWRRRASTSIASVTLLMKETLVRVAEPALVPAGVR